MFHSVKDRFCFNVFLVNNEGTNSGLQNMNIELVTIKTFKFLLFKNEQN